METSFLEPIFSDQKERIIFNENVERKNQIQAEMPTYQAIYSVLGKT